MSCYELKEVIIPASVQNVGSGAFYNTGLDRVTFEEGSQLEVIGEGAFSRTGNLKVITLPANLKKIGEVAFVKSGLEEVIFEEASLLEYIGNLAFWKSNNLKSIHIPRGVVIGDAAFDLTGCHDNSIFTPGAIIVNCL